MLHILPHDVLYFILSLMYHKDIFSLGKVNRALRTKCKLYPPYVKAEEVVRTLINRDWLTLKDIKRVCQIIHENNALNLLELLLDGDSPKELIPRYMQAYRAFAALGRGDLLLQVSRYRIKHKGEKDAQDESLFALKRAVTSARNITDIIYEMIKNDHISLLEEYLNECDHNSEIGFYFLVLNFIPSKWLKAIAKYLTTDKRIKVLTAIICSARNYIQDDHPTFLKVLMGDLNEVFRSKDFEVADYYLSQIAPPVSREDIIDAACSAGWLEMFMRYDLGPSSSDLTFLAQAIIAGDQKLIDYLLTRVCLDDCTLFTLLPHAANVKVCVLESLLKSHPKFLTDSRFLLQAIPLSWEMCCFIDRHAICVSKREMLQNKFLKADIAIFKTQPWFDWNYYLEWACDEFAWPEIEEALTKCGTNRIIDILNQCMERVLLLRADTQLIEEVDVVHGRKTYAPFHTKDLFAWQYECPLRRKAGLEGYVIEIRVNDINGIQHAEKEYRECLTSFCVAKRLAEYLEISDFPSMFVPYVPSGQFIVFKGNE